MKKFKKSLPFALAGVLLLSGAAVQAGTSADGASNMEQKRAAWRHYKADKRAEMKLKAKTARKAVKAVKAKYDNSMTPEKRMKIKSKLKTQASKERVKAMKAYRKHRAPN